MSTSLSKLAAQFPWAAVPLIVSAPMRVMAGPKLAVAASTAGGLGFIGPGVKTANMLSDLEEASTLIKNSRLASLGPTLKTLPVGVGFQVWSDDLDTATHAVREFKPCVVWLFAPKEFTDLTIWSNTLRDVSPNSQIWIQVGTLSEVKRLLTMGTSTSTRDGPDAIVVQGSEAGGHGRASDGLGLVSLLPEAADAVAASQTPEIPLLAAGGIADTRGASAALCLGASGIVLGTRFLAATEARISSGYQHEILRADDGAVSTTRTLLYNHLRGITTWPEEYSPRTIINQSFVEYRAGTAFEELKKRHDEHLQLGDAGWGPNGRLATYAGASVGLIHEVKDAGDIVRDQGGREEDGSVYRLGETWCLRALYWRNNLPAFCSPY
ncbi:nitronate monooxygenase [Aspergillus nidulans FGSC A4]|uniref:Oxidoreductase 2-nitropropane dioxygenase family, putative (AFU_orthologue AFUA_2G17430) n=1 Tax=Emericella nidulans (strain FGSC A4 / ATCC 38163 / CBS 112.46 / NRRL 194 / M139) TaxID=227321 RepID=C8V514_EMENI|nr:hypothetical protein [Aspergillus nidulans FGSC A4]CBF74663.1 TPA: oxidoreductase 2-nitropropane dioxygenase family, putative (AFU_orthologue; AFUA_2G17430) [Aspergillus nidulans FGSC A4]